MTSTKKDRNLIVNADDFGESEEITNGILEAHKNGIVTSASLLTNMPGFEHALSSIRDNPSLDVGIHLNMHRGVPLTNAVYLTHNGKFLRDIFRFTIRSYRNKKQARKEITAEFEAQIQKAISAGVHISHLDTEKHLHTLPFVFEIVLSLAEKYSIPAVRLPYEFVSLSALKNPAQLYKTLVMMLCAPLNKRLLRRSTRTSTHQFYGVSLSRHFTVPHLEKVIANLHPGFTELSCHPGYAPKHGENYIDAHREGELETLTSSALKNAITKNGIVLSTFFDIR